LPAVRYGAAKRITCQNGKIVQPSPVQNPLQRWSGGCARSYGLGSFKYPFIWQIGVSTPPSRP